VPPPETKNLQENLAAIEQKRAKVPKRPKLPVKRDNLDEEAAVLDYSHLYASFFDIFVGH
jgi:hypothetical protein